MIFPVIITIISEGVVAIGYSSWRNRPLIPVLSTSIFANLLTQSLLWVALNIFFRRYLMVLLIAEIMIWMIESALLYFIPANRLRLTDALLLSLLMNLVSLALGWFLPV